MRKLDKNKGMDNNLNSIKKTEIEAKFICPNGFSLDNDNIPIIANTLGLQYTKQIPYVQTDTYLDTPDYILLRSKSVLRIRQKGEDYIGTYKASNRAQGAVLERTEIEWILSNDEKRLWSEEQKPTIPLTVMDMLNFHGKALKKILALETYRCAAVVRNKEFKAEVSLDEVTFHSHRDQPPYREIEVELLQGPFEQFKQFIDHIQNHFKLKPAIDSKYRKGLLLVGKQDI